MQELFPARPKPGRSEPVPPSVELVPVDDVSHDEAGRVAPKFAGSLRLPNDLRYFKTNAVVLASDFQKQLPP